jgi:hypothetical protein
MRTLIGIPTRTNWEGLKALGEALWDEGYGHDVVVFNHGHHTMRGHETLGGFPRVVFSEGWPFYRMWNEAWRLAHAERYDAVTLLNDDVTLAVGSIAETLRVLSEDPDIGIVGFNWWRPVKDGAEPGMICDVYGAHRKGGIPGWAFTLRADLWGQVPPIDEAYHIWYGDDDLFQSVHAAGHRTVLALGAPVDHTPSSTLSRFPELLAKTDLDARRFMHRWGTH